MSHQNIDKVQDHNAGSNQQLENLKVIYADRILNGGFGPAVSRLTLAMEVSQGKYIPSALMVLPTAALIEAMSAMLDGLKENAELKNALVSGLDALREQINSIK